VLNRILTSALIFAAIPLVMRWLLSGPATAEAGQLRYSRRAKLFSLVVPAIPIVGIALIATLAAPPKPKDVPVILGIIGFFLALGVPLALEFFRVGHHYDSSGLDFRSPWSRARRIRWAEVEWIVWRPQLKWVDVRTRDGSVAHLSPMLSGLNEFAATALQQIRPEVLEANPEGCAVLGLFAAGVGGVLATSQLGPVELLAAYAKARESGQL
jgi:hypothetical protein